MHEFVLNQELVVSVVEFIFCKIFLGLIFQIEDKMVLFFIGEKFGDFGSQVRPFVMDLSLEKFEKDYKDLIGRKGFVFGLKLGDDFCKFLKDLLQ